MKKNNLLLTNANVITMDPNLPQASAIEVCNNNIYKVVCNKSLIIKKPNTEIIDCQQKTILPGFIDAHCHFIGLAERLVLPDISNVNISSIADIMVFVRKVANSTPPGEWIHIRGYQPYNIEDNRHPDRWDLDKATKSHPVCLTHVTGYINVLNSMALKKVNIDFYSEAVSGGLIERNLNNGEPNGILFNMRAYLAKFIPHIEQNLLTRGIRLASERIASNGITSIQDASQANSMERFNLYLRYFNSGIIKPRITMILGLESFLKGEHGITYEENDFLRINGVKIILSEASGELSPSLKQLDDILLQIHQDGKQAVIHAIEEHIIREAARVVARLLNFHPRSDHRHRIEHCSLCPPELAKFLASLGIIVVTQPNFVYYNGDRYLKTVSSSQRRYLYPFKTLSKSGLMLAASSDSPVVPENPLHGIFSAVTRQTMAGNFLVPEEKISVLEALKMYTINAARSAFEEDIKGSITPGKLADLILLNADPTVIDAQEIKNLRVEMVVIGGEIVYREGI